MSSSVHPGWLLMKYGIICCLRFSFVLISSKIFLNSSNCLNDGFRISRNTLSDVCSGATLSLPLTCLHISSRVYVLAVLLQFSSLLLCSSRSYLTPLPIKLFLISGSASTAWYMSSNWPWSVLRLGHTAGFMHEGRLHFSHTRQSLPPMPYMLADGPPKSLRYPLKSGILII